MPCSVKDVDDSHQPAGNLNENNAVLIGLPPCAERTFGK
jgi:hypothetical protein